MIPTSELIRRRNDDAKGRALDAIDTEIKKGAIGRIGDPITLGSKLINIVTETFLFCGQAAGKDLGPYCHLLAQEILRQYGGFFWEEIVDAICRGRAGEFGEFYGINPRTILKWIGAYVNAGYHCKYYERLQERYRIEAARQLTQRTEPTVEERRRLLDEKFQRYRADKIGLRPSGPMADITAAWAKNLSIPESWRDFVDEQTGEADMLRALGWKGATLHEIFDSMISARVENIQWPAA